MTVQPEPVWTLVVPDSLLAGATGWPGRWALSRMLGRSVSRRLGFRGSYEVIGWAVTGHAAATRAWAPAPVGWVADFQTDPPLGALRIDPVCLTPGPRGMSLTVPAALGLDESESARLVQSLAAALRDRGIGIQLAAADRWYMTLPHAPEGTWWSPEIVASGTLMEHLPAGEEGGELRRILNEIQMILHQQPDNIDRRARRAPEANSVWPWGWAQRPLPRVGAIVSRVHASHPYARGLAAMAGVPVLAAGAEADDPNGAGVVVIPEDRETDPEWLELTWGRRLRRAAARGRVGMVRLATPGGRVAEYCPHGRKQFRRHRSYAR